MKFTRKAENLIANFRGVPENFTSIYKRDIIQIDSAIEVILQKYKIGPNSIEDTLMHYWRDIVGEQTAHRCRPQRILNDKRLVIVTSNPVIRQELLFKKRAILKKLHSIPECKDIKDIVVGSG